MTNAVVYTRMIVVAILATLTALLISSISTSDAYAQETTLEQYDAACFDEYGEWLATDGCIRSAERMGIEVDNIVEPMRKGCTLSNMLEDYSCKGPQYVGYEEVSEQGTQSEQLSISEQARRRLLTPLPSPRGYWP